MSRLVVLAVGLGLAACAGPPPATGALFEDARALAVAADGTLWVVDADGVVALRGGLLGVRLAGVGTGDDAFLDPSDVDPTNGQTIFVADGAAGTILQFTEEARLAQTLVVPDVDPARPLRQPGEQTSRDGMRARPVAIAAGADGALYVADAGRRHVLRLDAEGAVERVLGAGALVEPVDLAVDDDGTLWVADAGRGRLQPFDPFGAPGGSVDLPDLGRLMSVAAGGDALVVSGTDAVALVRGGASEVVAIRVSEPIRGAVLARGVLVVLTPTRLAGPGDAGVD